MKNKINLVLLCVLTVVLSSCAGSHYGSSSNAKVEIKQLLTAEQLNPHDYAVKRDLGTGYYKAGDYDKALDKLMEARVMNPGDAKTIFYIGMSYEKKDMPNDAIKYYRSYNTLSDSRSFKNKISRRIFQLSNAQVTRAVARAVTMEKAIDVTTIPSNTVAVLDFENLTKSDKLNPLSKGLAQMLITDLAKAKELKVVERHQLNTLLKELELVESGLVDKESAPRVGKLLGARKLVKGGFMDLADKNIRIDASLTQTGTSETDQLTEVEGELEGIFKMQKELVFKIIDEMGVHLTKSEREAIQKVPTESLLAFMAYSRGLDFEDKGLYLQAKTQYQEALSLDPGFDMAQQNLNQAETAGSVSSAKADIGQLEKEFDDKFSDPVRNESTISRLVSTSFAAQTGTSPQGDNDTREPTQEATDSDKVLPPTIRVPIRIVLP